jgi:two-component system NtrC family sensor kinase
LLPDLESIVSDCREGAGRIRDIVLDLRTFSRLDEAELKHIDVHEGLDATIRLLSQYFTGNRLKLIRDYGELPKVECYAAQLNQVWMNLLTNAAQAIGSRSGEVRIITRQEADGISVKISDTAEGIAPEYLKRIFEPFFTTKPIGEGTGLGLSISYSIIEKHGGKITADSIVGKGTTFTTIIPIDAKSRRRAELNPKESANGSQNANCR